MWARTSFCGLRCGVAMFVMALGPFTLSLVSAEPKQPALHDLVVFDPGVHEDGLPAVRIEDGQVEIPPALHVHRYYYSGDKECQGPILSGGPTVVVAQHPRTSERLYIDVVLPAGAPLIAYNKESITYVYPDQRVKIDFHDFLSNKVRVKYLPGHGLVRTYREKSKKSAEHLHATARQSRLVSSLKETAEQRRHVVVGAVGVVQSTAAFTVDKASQAVDLIPGVQLLESIGQQAGARGAEEAVRQVGRARERAEGAERAFIKTIR